MPVETLVLIFLNQAGNTVRLTINNVKQGLTDADVKAAMENIIAKNIFDSTGGDLVMPSSAELIARSVQVISVK